MWRNPGTELAFVHREHAPVITVTVPSDSPCHHLVVEEDHMCLAVPGKVLSSDDINGSRVGRVQFGGISRTVCLDLVPEALVGDYVLVHVGYAIARVDQAEAEATYQALEAMGKLAEEGLNQEEPDEVRG